MEKRNYKRISMSLFLWYVPDYEHDEEDCKFYRVVIVKNLSPNGVFFIADEYLFLNTSLYVELKIPNISKRVNLSGKVLRINPNENLNFYNIAVRFAQEEPELTDFIDNTLNIETI